MSNFDVYETLEAIRVGAPIIETLSFAQVKSVLKELRHMFPLQVKLNAKFCYLLDELYRIKNISGLDKSPEWFKLEAIKAEHKDSRRCDLSFTLHKLSKVINLQIEPTVTTEQMEQELSRIKIEKQLLRTGILASPTLNDSQEQIFTQLEAIFTDLQILDEQVYVEPYFATYNPLSIFCVQEFLNSKTESEIWEKQRTPYLTGLFYTLARENATITDGVKVGFRSSMLKVVPFLEFEYQKNERCESFLRKNFINAYNSANIFPSKLTDSCLLNFFADLDSHRTVNKFCFERVPKESESLTRRVVFEQMFAMTLFKDFYPELFSDFLNFLPRSFINWSNSRQRDFLFFYHWVHKQLANPQKRAIFVWDELCQQLDRDLNLAVYPKPVLETSEIETSKIETRVVPKRFKEIYLCDQMTETPFHCWQPYQLLQYARMIGWNTDSYFTAFSNWEDDRKCLLSAIIELESLTF